MQLFHSDYVYLPVDNPRVRLIGTTNVVLRQQAREPRAQRSAIHPALTGSALLHWRHEDEVSLQQLELIVILRHIRVQDLQCLQGGRRLVVTKRVKSVMGKHLFRGSVPRD